MTGPSPETLASYLLAALAACGNAVANVMQRKAGLEQPQDRPFGLRMLLVAEEARTPTPADPGRTDAPLDGPATDQASPARTNPDS